MFERQELIIFVTGLMAIAISSILLFLLGMKAAILGFFIVIGGVLAFQFPRKSLYIFLIYLCFAGTITYYIPGIYRINGDKISFSTIYPIFQLFKDIFYFPPLIAIIFSREFFQEMLPKIKPLKWALLLFISSCLLTFIFVNIPSQFTAERGNPFLMGILGLKIWLSYIPLIFCAFFLIKSHQNLLFISRLQTVLIIICCSLTITQFLLLIGGICQGNIGLSNNIIDNPTLQARCFVGGSLLYYPEWNLIRLPGTFVSPWQWGWFLIASIFFTVANSQSDTSKLWRIVSWIGTILVIFTTIISGQRIALLLVPIIFISLFLLTEKRDKKFAIKLGIMSFLSVILLALPFIQKTIFLFLKRWNYSPPFNFIFEQIQFAIAKQKGIFGNGLATTSSMARKLGEITPLEVFHAQLTYEMGYLGLISFLILVSMIVFFIFKTYQLLTNKSLKNLCICLGMFILLISYNVYYYPLIVDPIAVYYWLVIGIIFKLPEIDKNLEKTNQINSAFQDN